MQPWLTQMPVSLPQISYNDRPPTTDCMFFISSATKISCLWFRPFTRHAWCIAVASSGLLLYAVLPLAIHVESFLLWMKNRPRFVSLLGRNLKIVIRISLILSYFVSLGEPCTHTECNKQREKWQTALNGRAHNAWFIDSRAHSHVKIAIMCYFINK